MKYKYRSTCRFTVLIQVGNDLVHIRPNQVIETDEKLNYDILKEIVKVKEPVSRRGRKKKETNYGTSSIS
jgi:hypothetical protein